MPPLKNDDQQKAVYTKKEMDEQLDFYSSKTSEIVRQLGLAGLAISWLFLYNDKTGVYTNKWIYPTFIFIVAILLDLFQYTFGTKTYFNAQQEGNNYTVNTKDILTIKRYFDLKKYTILLGFIILFGMIAWEMYFGGKA